MATANLSEIRVLIVDDNPLDRLVVRQFLEQMNIQTVEEVSDGQKGLHLIEDKKAKGLPFQLVVTDWKMPVKDGLHLLRELRMNPENRNIPVLMMSSHYDASKVAEAVAATSDGYLFKPLDFDTFKLNFERAVRKYSNKKAV